LPDCVTCGFDAPIAGKPGGKCSLRWFESASFVGPQICSSQFLCRAFNGSGCSPSLWRVFILTPACLCLVRARSSCVWLTRKLLPSALWTPKGCSGQTLSTKCGSPKGENLSELGNLHSGSRNKRGSHAGMRNFPRGAIGGGCFSGRAIGSLPVCFMCESLFVHMFRRCLVVSSQHDRVRVRRERYAMSACQAGAHPR